MHKACHRNMKSNNQFYVGGNAIRKYYNDRTGVLILSVSIRILESRHSKGGNTIIRANNPGIVAYGDLAKELNERINPDKQRYNFIFACCHVEPHFTNRTMPDGSIKRNMTSSIVIDDLIESRNTINENVGYLRGKVKNIWHSKDENKKFYIITIDADGHSVPFTFFDPTMSLDLKTGDEAVAEVYVQTNVKEDKTSDRRDGRIFYSTLVANQVAKADKTDSPED